MQYGGSWAAKATGEGDQRMVVAVV
uniref:Uncharacterized protein n=1 Tax=Arundo donax TaxID=35708 RepID=A0A0A9AXV7_ARUDO